jgi:hypothetical protein
MPISEWWWLGIIIAIGVAGAAWWWVPKWQMKSITAGDPKERAAIEDNFRKTIGQALGGIAVLIGAASAYLQFSQQQKIASDQFLQQQQAAHDLLISNQVAKAFEQLGSSQMVVRLGGIYALEGVMNGSAQYDKPVLEALCAFVREGTVGVKIGESPATDIQATLIVIGRRDPGEGLVDLRRARLPGAYLTSANLTGAYLTEAYLPGASLVRADLTGAYLPGADLTRANLIRADLTGAHLIRANLTGAYLTGANLTHADLTGANLTGAYLTLVSLTDANLTGSHLTRADLTPPDLTGANLTDASLIRADLTEANLTEANLTGANLTHTQGITQSQLDLACGVGAKLPPHLALQPCRPAP